MTSRITKVPKIPVDQLISGAVKQYIDYIKTDGNNLPNGQLLPILNSASEQNSTSDEDINRTNGMFYFN